MFLQKQENINPKNEIEQIDLEQNVVFNYEKNLRNLATQMKRVAHVPVQKWNSILQASWWEQLF